MKVGNMTLRILLGMAIIVLAGLSSCGGQEKTADTATEALGTTGNPAIDGLTEAISKSPEDASLYAKRGVLFFENDGYDEAIRDLTIAVKLDSLQPAYYHRLADAYLDYFKSREALGVMKEASERFPTDEKTLLKLSEYYLILRQHEESMKVIDQLLKQDPQNGEAYFMFGMNFKESGDTVRAINSFQKAVELDATIVDGWINLGQLYAERDDPLALRYFDNATRVAPDDIVALHAKADYLSAKGSLEEAIGLYGQIVVLDPQYDEAYYNSGLIYLDMDSLAQAEAQFDLTLKVSPTHIRAYYYRGLSRELQGRAAEALADFQQALRMAPNYEDAQAGVERLKQEG